MTDPVVRLHDSRLAVQPGKQARTNVTVANPGQVVEGFRLEVLGPAAPWAQVVPPELPVYPHAEGTAAVVFSPPPGRAAPSGSVPFAVRARSTVDGSRCATEEGDLDVGAVFGLQGRLSPVTSSGRWSAAHAVELTNWGNATERLRVTASDPDEQLAFLVHPEVVELPVGATAVVGVRVRARQPQLRGTTTRRPFQVVVEPADAAPGPPPPPGTDPRRAVLDGALAHRPVLSRGFVAGVGVLLLATSGVVAWAMNGAEAEASQRPVSPAAVAPTGLTATPLGSDSIQLTWTAPARVEHYELRHIDPATRDQAMPRTVAVAPLDGALAGHAVTGLEPGTEHCFQLVTVREEVRSTPSAAVCATTAAQEDATPPPAGADTPPPTDVTPTPDQPATNPPENDPGNGEVPDGEVPDGELRPDEWIAVVRITPTGQTDRRDAEQQKADLQALGFQVGELVNREYPDIGLAGGAEAELLYVRTPAESEESARAFCRDNPAVTGPVGCRVVQPGERAAD